MPHLRLQFADGEPEPDGCDCEPQAVRRNDDPSNDGEVHQHDCALTRDAIAELEDAAGHAAQRAITPDMMRDAGWRP